MKKLLKIILYQPYFLLFFCIGGNFYYFSTKHSFWETMSFAALWILNLLIIAFIFKFLRASLLRLVNRIRFFTSIPNSVLTGYLFIFAIFAPIPAVIIAIFAKLFIWENTDKSYTDAYGNEVTQIKSLTPTVILSRKEQETGEEEHIVMTKLKKKPKKIIYE